MRKGSLIVAIVVAACLSGVARAQDTAAGAERPDRGDRVERRLDRQGDAVNRRLDRVARRAHAADRDHVARRLNRVGNRVDWRLDRRGRQVNRRIDRRGPPRS